jgi:hypothetical protein
MPQQSRKLTGTPLNSGHNAGCRVADRETEDRSPEHNVAALRLGSFVGRSIRSQRRWMVRPRVCCDRHAQSHRRLREPCDPHVRRAWQGPVLCPAPSRRLVGRRPRTVRPSQRSRRRGEWAAWWGRRGAVASSAATAARLAEAHKAEARQPYGNTIPVLARCEGNYWRRPPVVRQGTPVRAHDPRDG